MPRRKATKGRPKVEMSGRPRHRSRSLKRLQRRTPGGRTVTHYKHKKPGKHICAICKNFVHGRSRGRPVEIRRLPKSKRAPERPFGGMLCSKCTRKVLSLRARLIDKRIKLENIPLSLKQYIGD